MKKKSGRVILKMFQSPNLLSDFQLVVVNVHSFEHKVGSPGNQWREEEAFLSWVLRSHSERRCRAMTTMS